jgi:hypothetical protein
MSIRPHCANVATVTTRKEAAMRGKRFFGFMLLAITQNASSQPGACQRLNADLANWDGALEASVVLVEQDGGVESLTLPVLQRTGDAPGSFAGYGSLLAQSRVAASPEASPFADTAYVSVRTTGDVVNITIASQARKHQFRFFGACGDSLWYGYSQKDEAATLIKPRKIPPLP